MRKVLVVTLIALSAATADAQSYTFEVTATARAYDDDSDSCCARLNDHTVLVTGALAEACNAANATYVSGTAHWADYCSSHPSQRGYRIACEQPWSGQCRARGTFGR